MAKKKPPGRTEFNQQDRMAGIKGRAGPLGGAPPVKIPPLDAKPISGPRGEPLTMHQQAEALQDPTNPNSPLYDPQLAELAQQQQAGALDRIAMDPNPQPQQAKKAAGPFGGVGGPTLPPEAQRDPRFVGGVGSAYTQNQPHPAFQGGQAQRGRRSLSDETVGGLEALQKFQKEAQQEQEKQSGEATKANAEERVERETPEAIKELMGTEDPDAFFAQFQQELDQLSTPELRTAIEERVDEMAIEQLLEEGEIRQDVPIVRGKFEPTFRTISGEESLSIKRTLFGVQGGDVYVNELMSLYQLTAGLYAVNGKPLPSHLDDRKRFNVELFQTKFRQVQSFPMPMLASLSINFTWFDQRSRKLFVDIEALKNG